MPVDAVVGTLKGFVSMVISKFLARNAKTAKFTVMGVAKQCLKSASLMVKERIV